MLLLLRLLMGGFLMVDCRFSVAGADAPAAQAEKP
jgi:hypothetical protein